jgi:hypothetical protein
MTTYYVVSKEYVSVFFTTKEQAQSHLENIEGDGKTLTEHTRTCGCLSDGQSCQVWNNFIYCQQCI